MQNRLLGNPAESCYEFRAIKKDNSIIWLRAIANRIEFDGQLAVQGMFLDITEVKQTEEEVRNLARFPSENPNPVLRISKDGTVLYANASTQAHLRDFKIKKGERAPDILLKKALEVLGSGVEKSFELQNGNRQFLFSMAPITEANYVNVYGFNVTERKKTENKLRDSEERFRELANSLPDIVFETDAKGMILYVNDRAFAIAGYSSEELKKGLNIIQFILPEEKERARKNIQRLIEGGIYAPDEYTFVRKNGTTFPALIMANPHFCNNKVMGLRGFVLDISERKKAENLLRESEEKYRLLVDFAHEGIFALDPRYSIVFVNPRMAEILGYEESEISGKSVFCFIPERGFGHLIHYLEYCKQGISGEFELELICKGGLVINVLFSTSSIKDDAGNFVGTLVLVSDVTARKKIEERLRQERETLEKVTENIGAGLTLISKDYHILWANNYLKKLNGSLENKICYSTFNTLNKICPDCGVNKVFNGASSDTREYLNQDLSKKGLPCWFEIIATPVKDDNGEIIAALELTVDITEKKRMQEKLIDYSQNLENKVKEKTQQLSEAQAIIIKSERLAAIGELAGMIGHDLRNPLSGIKNAAYFLNKNDASCSKEKNKEMLKIIDDAVNHSDKIINDLLDYARNLRLELQDLSAKKLLDEALQMVQIPVRIEIHNNLSEGLRFQVDLDKIKRVFINLIKNAIDAMPNGGILEISEKIQNDYIEISFADQGIGISEENKSKTFLAIIYD